MQFVRGLRTRRPGLHRWRVVLVSGLMIGGSAVVMSRRMAIGGNVVLHREWMIRAFAIGLAVATIRPIVGVFRDAGSDASDAAGFLRRGFLDRFTMPSIVAEVWIRYTRAGDSRTLATDERR